MSDLVTAQKLAWSLAQTLMVAIVLFRGDLGYGVMPAAEYDGDPEAIVREIDPFG